MPDVAVHLAFGKDVRNSLEPRVRDTLADAPYQVGLLGPDPWFMHQPWVHPSRGRRMHTTRTGNHLIALAEEGKKSDCPKLIFSYLAGFLCHYALDAATHPYIIWRTTHEFQIPEAHRGFEHSLDMLELRRQGVWGEKHPITGHSFPRQKLPREMAPALNAAYRRVYGWENAWKDLNRAYKLFWRAYRLMENPRGLGAWATRRTRSPKLQSLAYSESPFNDIDVENLSGQEWRHSHDETIRSRESFPVMREAARQKAVRMITAAWEYVFGTEENRDALAGQLGNESYLSGLKVTDPRNWAEPTMLPAPDPENPPPKEYARGGTES